MSAFSFPYDYSTAGRRRTPVTSQRTGGNPTYLDEQPVYGDTSQMLPGTAVARAPQVTQAPQAPAAPYFALQNARSDRQRQQTIMGNAVQARSNANYAAAAPLPSTPPLPTPAGSTVAPLPSRSASAAQAAPGRIQMTEQAAREMLRNLGATRPGMTLEQLRPEFTQTLGKYGVDGNALWSQWQQAGTLGKSDYVNGQTTSPAQPQVIAPANQQAGTGGIAMLPGGQSVVTNANGRQVGGPIAQGAPLPSTTTPTYGAEPGYTPLPTGGNYAQAAPSAQPTQVLPAGFSAQPAQQPPTANMLPGDGYATAARGAYIGRQNDRADLLTGGFFTNRDNATNVAGAEADALRSGASQARDLQRQNGQLQNQVTRMQNSQTLAQGRTGATAERQQDADKRAYYTSQINQARENLRAATATFDEGKIGEAQKALNDAHNDFRTYLGDKTGLGPQGQQQAAQVAPAAAGNAAAPAPLPFPGAAPGTPGFDANYREQQKRNAASAGGAQPQQPPQQQAAQRQVVRSGTDPATGKPVKQYSDGSIVGDDGTVYSFAAR